MAQGLTVKQERFCQKYLECGNASEAYRFAYPCKNMSDKTINEAASRLLKNSKASARVAELQAQTAEICELGRSDIIRVLSGAIMADITDYATPEGCVRAEDIKKMPIEKRRLIEKIEATRDGVKITLMSKAGAIERLCKITGWDAPAQSEIKLTNELERYSDEELYKIANGGHGK